MPETLSETLLSHRQAFLAAVDQVVPFEGWSNSAMKEIAEIAEMDEFSLAELCPDGIASAIALWADQADEEMIAAKDILPWENMSIGFRVQKLIEHRLKFLQIHKETEARSFQWLCLPGRTHIATKIGFQTVDRLWNLVEENDDPEKDFSYYSKRMTTLAIFSATIFYWLQDSSPQSRDTFAYLQRRLQQHLAFTKCSHKLRSWFRMPVKSG